jgi:hypothetical protein
LNNTSKSRSCTTSAIAVSPVTSTRTPAYESRTSSYIPTHTRGVSDIIGCIPKTGRFLAIEVKRPGGKPTPEQQQFIDTINAAGGLAFVARSVEEVEQRLMV